VLVESKFDFMAIIAQPETRNALSEELRSNGFDQNQIEFVLDLLPTERTSWKEQAKWGTWLLDSLEQVNELVPMLEGELVREGMIAGEYTGNSPSSKAFMKKIMSVLVGGYQISYDLVVPPHSPLPSVVTGLWTATSAQIKDENDDSFALLSRDVIAQSFRLRGDIDLLKQRDPIRAQDTLAKLEDFMVGYYLSLPAEKGEAFLRYLESMAMGTVTIRQKASARLSRESHE
jgi:hypothetical protein